MPIVVSLQAARPATYVHEGHGDGIESTWITAFFKMPVTEPVQVSRLGLAGDE